MESEIIIKEILKKIKEERERINKKTVSGIYGIDECRNEYDECDRCIDIVLNVIETNYGKDYVKKIIKESLID